MLIHITLLIILDITLQRAFFTLKYVSKFFVKHAICIIDLLDTYLLIFPFSQCMSHQSRHTSQCRHKKSVPNAQHNQAVSVSACVWTIIMLTIIPVVRDGFYSGLGISAPKH